MKKSINYPVYSRIVNADCRKTLDRARNNSLRIIKEVSKITDQYLKKQKFSLTKVCIILVGSIGRLEALESSDIDLIPILKDEKSLKSFFKIDKELRNMLSKSLSINVSKGEDLTKCISISQISDLETIGGDKDDSSSLTKRVLVLTEGRQAGGGFKIGDIRKIILDSYSKNQTTMGRHVLSLCNDIARYYRTLCIEYKAKIDNEDKDWCTRNLKLRHSRKFWYFSTLLSIAHCAEEYPKGEQIYISSLLEIFKLCPCERLYFALKEYSPLIGKLFEHFAWFLEFLSNKKNRGALKLIKHDRRYDCIINNPFPGLKYNSDLMHEYMIQIINAIPQHIKRKIYDWFLL